MVLNTLLRKAFKAGRKEGADIEEWLEDNKYLITVTKQDIINNNSKPNIQYIDKSVIDYELKMKEGIVTSKHSRNG